MVLRSILLRHAGKRPLPLPWAMKRLTSTGPLPSASSTFQSTRTPSKSSPHNSPIPYEKSWLTRKVEASPIALKVFMGFAKVLGYGSPKQLAARRAFGFYEEVCAVRPDDEAKFWQEDCHMPPTFQSWFTITNLHIWLLTVRLRGLPAEHGKHYIQALIDHYFIDVEDRIRAVLQPRDIPSPPYTFPSPFYVNPNDIKIRDGEHRKADLKKRAMRRAPDRIVTRQMKIFKEQWAGLGLSFDLGLVQGDMELAGAIWRNLLGARGAQGIEYPGSTDAPITKFRRSVNLVGGEVVNVAKVDLDKEESTDDGSGVHDFPPSEVEKYVKYPEVMAELVEYIRRELVRLEKVSDHDILQGNWKKLKFGPVITVKQ